MFGTFFNSFLFPIGWGKKTGITSGAILVHQDLLLRSPSLEDHRWEEGGVVDKLYLYPLKSGKPLQLQRAKVEKYGLSDEIYFDRQFMVIDKRNRACTGRVYSTLLLIRARFVAENDVEFSAERGGACRCNVSDRTNDSNLVETDVFGQKCHGYNLGDDVSQWITTYLDHETNGPFRILYHPFNPRRNGNNVRVNPLAYGELTPNAKPSDTGLFSDGYGFSLATFESIQKLNGHLHEEKVDLTVEETRLRPNILIRGTKSAFDEDNWTHVKISNTVFRVGSPCRRCVFVTVDPDTGIRDPLTEPLKTLRKFRSSLDRRGKEAYGRIPFFAINLGIDDEFVGGTIHAGDKIFTIRGPASSEKLARKLLKWTLVFSIAAAIISTQLIN